MAKFALLKSGVFVETRDYPSQPPDLQHKGVAWLPFEVDRPAFDPATQVMSGPEIVVETKRVVKRWTVRNKTAEELAQDADREKEMSLDSMDRVLLLVAFDHENRVRALEGKQPVTAAQFRSAIKARL